MANALSKVPFPVNEPILSYKKGSSERALLQTKLTAMGSGFEDIPIIIGGKEIRTGNTEQITAPHDHSKKLGIYHKAGTAEVKMAIEASLKAKKEWAEVPWEQRISVFLKAAELLSGKWRPVLNAATMLGQSKVVHQAEIDSACELIDFWRFNSYFLTQIMADQPYSPKGLWNRSEYRPLEGFVFAVTPFNFTSIAGNLPTAPAIAGNTAIWKPASSSVYSGYFIMKLLEEAGLPGGVINFVPGRGSEVGDPVLDSPDLAGIHFTGSTSVFKSMWKRVGDNIDRYKYYPRIIGETGGKDFIFAHNKADVKALATAALRGAFEYQGQKCSAASRMYIPNSIFTEFRDLFCREVSKITIGNPEDFTNFMSAVIDKSAYTGITSYIDYAKKSSEAEIITGGGYDEKTGYFIEPTTIVTTNPISKQWKKKYSVPFLQSMFTKIQNLKKHWNFATKLLLMR